MSCKINKGLQPCTALVHYITFLEWSTKTLKTLEVLKFYMFIFLSTMNCLGDVKGNKPILGIVHMGICALLMTCICEGFLKDLKCSVVYFWIGWNGVVFRCIYCCFFVAQCAVLFNNNHCEHMVNASQFLLLMSNTCHLPLILPDRALRLVFFWVWCLCTLIFALILQGKAN